MFVGRSSVVVESYRPDQGDREIRDIPGPNEIGS